MEQSKKRKKNVQTISLVVKMKTTELQIKENSEGDLYFNIPDNLLERLAWEDGDEIKFVEKDGGFILTKVKEKFPLIPIIIMTAYSDLDTAVSAFQKGAFEYIAKPFDIDKVLEIINQALEQTKI